MMSQVVFLTLVVLMFFCTPPTAGVALDEECGDTQKCDSTSFLYCKKVSTSCQKGLCDCIDGYMRDAGACIRTGFLGSNCDGGTPINTHNAECIDDKIACKPGYSKVSNALCRNDNEKVLGEACDTSTGETCYVTTDTTYGTGSCSRDYCGCRSTNKKWAGLNCITKTIGDPCGRGGECPGRSHCVSGTCQCVKGEKQFRGDCWEETEDYGVVKEGEECDRNKKECALELGCSRCQENKATNKYTCNQRKPYSGSVTRLANILVVFPFSIAVLSYFLL